MSASTAAVAERLGAAHEALGALLAEHVDDYDEVLPHVLLGEVLEQLLDGQLGEGAAGAALDVLEEAMGSPDPDVQELVAVSFVEPLVGDDGPAAVALRARFGPNLAAEAARMG